MKTKLSIHLLSQRTPLRVLSFVSGLLLFANFLTPPPARAGLTFTVDLYVTGGTYVFYTPLNTNDLAPAAAYGTYTIFSPGWPTNGSWREITYDTNGVNTANGSENFYTNLASALNQITNGTWTMQFSNAVVTNAYHFTVSVPGGLSSNKLPVTYITYPANGALGVTNRPVFTWQGQPTNWPVTGSAYELQFPKNGSFYYPDPETLPVTQSNWAPGVALAAIDPSEYTAFYLNYATNYTGTLFVASTPLNATNSQPLGGWLYSSTLESGGSVGFAVAVPPSSSTSHKLIAHYAFDDSGFAGLDTSTNGNDISCGSSWGGNVSQQFTTDAVAGGGALQFFGQSSLTPCYGTSSFNNWTNALCGSFTVSAWIKTTTVVGNDGDELDDDDGQIVIYMNNDYNGVLPLGITGTKAAFATGLPESAYGQDTLNSTNSITTGSYVHVVTTRDQGSGLKQIYINGVLDSSDYGEPGILNGGSTYASIGGELFAPYTGKLDDVQIYSGVLGPAEIANLYHVPGSTIPDGIELTFSVALDTPNLDWTASGDTSWFIETTNTYNGDPYAAQSGVVVNNQSSTITTTVTGPAELTFYWAAQGSEMNDFDYVVYLDGDPNNGYLDDIYYDVSWYQDGPLAIPSGQHTVSWTTFAYGDDDPTEAGFLDQVVLAPATVSLQHPQIKGSNFQFQFFALYGFTYNVLSTTNLASGPWVTDSTISGDDSTHEVSVPYNTPRQQFFTVQPQ